MTNKLSLSSIIIIVVVVVVVVIVDFLYHRVEVASFMTLKKRFEAGTLEKAEDDQSSNHTHRRKQGYARGPDPSRTVVWWKQQHRKRPVARKSHAHMDIDTTS